VDLSCWLVQFCTANRSPAFVRDKVYLKNLFHRIRALLALNCSLIFVTGQSRNLPRPTCQRIRTWVGKFSKFDGMKWIAGAGFAIKFSSWMLFLFIFRWGNTFNQVGYL
jgi:hypothetical protein